MPQAFDPRLVSVTLETVSGRTVYSGLAMRILGTKFANALQNECEVTIVNLDKQTQDYILTETSPYTLNHTPKTITVAAGRESYGTFQVYVGNIITSSLSQPPDIGVTIRCLTGNFQKGNVLVRGQPTQISLAQISKQLAQDLNMSLTFQATNRTLHNYIYSGTTLSQVTSLNFTGGVNVFIDDNQLIVKDQNTPLNSVITEVNANSGMIGIPEITEQGVRVRFLIDNKTKLGGGLEVLSIKNPAVDGLYVIYKLGFEIATREIPFYYIAEAARQQ